MLKLRADPEGFNSILVRLKGKVNVLACADVGVFQFHTGSIKSRQTVFNPKVIGWFQFHTGSIKSQVGSVHILT